MASSPKRAKDQRAHLVLIDESGMMMAPLVRRSLAPAGRTPILKQKASHRDRVSLIAALSISPVRQRLGLRFRTLEREYVNNVRAADFLRSLLRDLRGRVLVIWDRGNMHRGDPIRKLLAQFPRLELHFLPPYAPELNPVEHLWNHLKYGRFPNYAPPNTQQLNHRVRCRLQSICKKQHQLQTFLNASQLSFDSLTERQ